MRSWLRLFFQKTARNQRLGICRLWTIRYHRISVNSKTDWKASCLMSGVDRIQPRFCRRLRSIPCLQISQSSHANTYYPFNTGIIWGGDTNTILSIELSENFNQVTIHNSIIYGMQTPFGDVSAAGGKVSGNVSDQRQLGGHSDVFYAFWCNAPKEIIKFLIEVTRCNIRSFSLAGKTSCRTCW